eukprot:Pgem_evm1s14427
MVDEAIRVIDKLPNQGELNLWDFFNGFISELTVVLYFGEKDAAIIGKEYIAIYKICDPDILLRNPLKGLFGYLEGSVLEEQAIYGDLRALVTPLKHMLESTKLWRYHTHMTIGNTFSKAAWVTFHCAQNKSLKDTIITEMRVTTSKNDKTNPENNSLLYSSLSSWEYLKSFAAVKHPCLASGNGATRIETRTS